jgi:hypothetical protein
MEMNDIIHHQKKTTQTKAAHLTNNQMVVSNAEDRREKEMTKIQ